MAAFAKAYPLDPVDVIISDYMSEANMVTKAATKIDSDSSVSAGSNLLAVAGPAFETSFLEALEPALPDLAKYGIRVAVNAGASDPEGLYKVCLNMIYKKGLASKLKLAWISGDEVLPAVKSAMKDGSSKFKNIYTGEELSSWSFDPIYAQAYLGGLGIAKAFSEGAMIVICGRVSDASPIIGAAYWFHKWRRDEIDKLANAFVAGHLLECSTYVSGGNFTGFKSLEHAPNGGWSDIGFPIGEISADGSVIITKQINSGGAVTVDTCSSQLLYEIQGPWYYNSDVTAVLDGLYFEQLASNRVALRGVKALPPPPTTKVGLTARGGWQAEASYFLTGLDVPAKARMLEAQLRKGLAPYSMNYTLLSFSVLGSAGVDADNQNAATATFRIFAQASKASYLEPKRFLRPIIDNIMQGYPGSTFHLDFRQGMPKPYFEYYVTLLPQSFVKHTVHLQTRWPDVYVDYPITPPDTTKTKTFPERQPSQETTSDPIDLSTFGPTKRLPLGILVHARSGDKGSDDNCGFWISSQSPQHKEKYTWLRNLLSVETIKQLLGKDYDPSRVKIERFELPNLGGVHFLFRNLLDRGVTSTGSVDFLGKNVAEYLRARYVDVPQKFLVEGARI